MSSHVKFGSVAPHCDAPTDVMIADYMMENAKVPHNPNMIQKMIYSDGVNVAGDDILESLITDSVIPALSNALKDGNKEDNLYSSYGPSSPDADKQIRIESMYGLLEEAELLSNDQTKIIIKDESNSLAANVFN